MDPPVRADIEIVPFEGAEVVYLEVPPLDPLMRPSHVRSKGAYGGSFVRSGDGDRRLTAYEVTQLLSSRGQPKEDSEAVEDATLEDLDGEAVAELLRRLRHAPTRAFDVDDVTALRRAGAVTEVDGVAHPTLAGLLCMGVYPQQFFPQLFVSFVALPGSTLGESMSDGTRFLDNVNCDGTIPQMLEGVLAAARRNMRQAAVIRGGGRDDVFDYPVEVIRELVVNALLHRDYSPHSLGTQVQVELYPDRLVVKSPGGLFGNVDPSQLGVEEVSSTRNAALARLLADVVLHDGMPVSENRGSGLSFAVQRLRRAGMSPPEFDVSPGHLHVTVPQHALLDPSTVQWIESLGATALSNEQHIALALMRSTGTVSNEMLRAWGVESHTATVALRGLTERGLALKRGGRRYATYELADGSGSDGLFAGVLPASPPQRRVSSGDSKLEAVLQAVLAGKDTTKAISQHLGLEYTATTRRINALLQQGRLQATAPPRSKHRRFIVTGDS